MDLSQLSDQLSEKLNEKLKETSTLTREIACRILERVREFKETFSGWPDTVSPWQKPEAPVKSVKPLKKVYHRQPTRQAKAKSSGQKSAVSKSKRSQPKKTSRTSRKTKK